MVTFRTEGAPCACGLRPRGIEVAQVRVNKGSLRITGLTLGAMPWRCPECGEQRPDSTTVRRWLEPADAAKVSAVRARKWPAKEAS